MRALIERAYSQCSTGATKCSPLFTQEQEYNATMFDVARRDALPARRHASAGVIATVLCLCVCLSVTRRYCIETAARIELVFAIRVSLDLSHNAA